MLLFYALNLWVLFMSTNQIPEIHPELIAAIEEVFLGNPDILLVNLCTAEGQGIRSFIMDDLRIKSDDITKAASGIFELSQLPSKQLFGKKLDIVTIENEKGHILFVKTKYLQHRCVLTVAAKPSTPLATIRFIAKRLAKAIKSIN